MKIELLTPEQHTTILSAYENYPELTLQNKGYEYINRNTLSNGAKEHLKQVETILKDTICGFSSFSNFKLDKNDNIQLRIQYNYNYGTNDLPFTGVGYVLLSELLNGFNE